MTTQARGGIKFFTGKEAPSLVILSSQSQQFSADKIRDLGVWRPEDTVKAAELLFQTGRLLVEGEAQTGKGTILFGISKILDELGLGYLFIDGHHQEANAESVVNSIAKAEDEHKAIFYDSLDYLFLGSRKIRQLSKPKQSERTRKIVSALTSAAVPLVGTFHGPNWRQHYIDQNLFKQYRDFIDTFAVYELPICIPEPKSVQKFLEDNFVIHVVAQAYISLASSPAFITAMSYQYGDADRISSITQSMSEFAVLKKLVHEDSHLFQLYMHQIVTRESPQAMLALARLVEANSHEATFLPLLRGS